MASPSADLVVDAIIIVVQLALATMLVLRGRRTATLWLGAVLVGRTALLLANDLAVTLSSVGWRQAATACAFVYWSLGAGLLVALLLPSGLWRRVAWVAWTAYAVVPLALLFLVPSLYSSGGVPGPLAYFHVFQIAWLPLGGWLLLRRVQRAGHDGTTHALFLVGVALLLIQFFDDGLLSWTLVSLWTTDPPGRFVVAGLLALHAILYAMAVTNLLQLTRGPRPSPARVALGALLVQAASVVLVVLLAPRAGDPLRVFFASLWDLALPLLLAYALLSDHVFGVHVRLTVRRSTVAAAFLAVFFVGTQVAQNFFTTRFQWAWGGVSAGILLFALSPLQRAAERVAVAVAAPAAPRKGPAAYREALEAAMKDGTLSRNEERRLTQLADALGLTPGETLAARDDVERQHRVGRA